MIKSKKSSDHQILIKIYVFFKVMEPLIRHAEMLLVFVAGTGNLHILPV